ncbi:wax ester/triacylglycerol synthase domain-containing protein [Cryptosporangium aurantiacum]|uniref:wax ester/triacylglycerol synthase domain-containing protein n=1 Tax=Cryptosporangium aurantiacum TaxID=134849 RepID=UPI003CCC2C42
MAVTGLELPPSAVDVDYGALGWGAGRTMSDFEAGMWRLEAAEPRLRSTIAAIDVLDTTPDWDRLVAAHEWALGVVPRFRMRVVDPPFQLGKPVWSVDPEFDLGYHLRRIRLPEPGTFAAALELCRTVVDRPFDRARPPWEALLVEGLADGTAIYLLKTHHSITDGMGGMQLVTLLHSRRREPTPDKPSALPPPPEQLSGLDALREQLTDQIRTLPETVLSRAQAGLRLAERAVRDPGSAIGFTQSLLRLAAPPSCPPSPILRGRGLGRRFGTLETTVDELRGAAKAAGGSLNDAYLAALLAGFRRYHERLDAPIDLLPIGMPISLRDSADPMGGNRFGVARFAAPIGVRDPADRIRRIRELVLDARAEPAADILTLAAPALSRLPVAAVARWYLGQTSLIDLQASNVAGIPVPVYMAGARIDRMFPFAPAPGCGVMATLVSHTGTCCIGVTIDTAAVTEPDVFLECLAEGLDEVLALRPAKPRTPKKRPSSGRTTRAKKSTNDRTEGAQ